MQFLFSYFRRYSLLWIYLSVIEMWSLSLDPLSANALLHKSLDLLNVVSSADKLLILLDIPRKLERLANYIRLYAYMLVYTYTLMFIYTLSIYCNNCNKILSTEGFNGKKLSNCVMKYLCSYYAEVWRKHLLKPDVKVW